MATLSDAELVSQLRDHGYNPGPITDTTRSVYVKKLNSFLNPSSTSRANTKNTSKKAKTKPTHQSNNEVEKHHTPKSDVTPSRSRTPVNTPSSNRKSSILSTQDSQVFLSTPRNTNHPNVMESNNIAGRDSSFSHASDSQYDEDDSLSQKLAERMFKQPLFRSHQKSPSSTKVSDRRSLRREETDDDDSGGRQIGAGHTPTTKTYIYFKDSGRVSDVDSDEEPSQNGGVLSNFTSWFNRSGSQTSPQQQSSVRQRDPPIPSYRGRLSHDTHRQSMIKVSDNEQSDSEVSHKSPFFQRFFGSGSSLRDKGTTTSPSLLFTPPRSPVTRSRMSTTASRYSVLSNDDQLPDSRFHDHDDTSSQTKSYWQQLYPTVMFHLPNLILICAIVVLVALAAGYWILGVQHGEFGKMADIQKLVCNSNVPQESSNTVDVYQCILQRDLDQAMPLLSTAFDILSQYAGEYHCASSTGVASPRLAISALQGLVQRRTFLSSSDFARSWKNALFLLLHVGKPHFGLVAFDSADNELGPQSKSAQIKDVQSLRPYFTGVCRLRRLVSWFLGLCLTGLWLLLGVGALVTFLFALRWVRRRRQDRIDKRANLIRDIVGDVIRLLQKQLHENETAPNVPPYLSVNEIRQSLRHRYAEIAALWPEVVRYIYEVETCIGVQEWRGIGEAWQWQGGTGWQGSALVNESQKPPFNIPPTECLKVRNMFSSDIDESGQRRIKRELLSKLASCGPIMHIGLDSVGSKGLVYIKCANAEVAGRVFHTIHAHYFDGRLLIVKFLRNTKYCLRFPEAHNCYTNLRLSDYE